MAAEGRAAAGAVLRFVLGDVLGGRFLDGVAVRQLLVDEHRADRQDRAVAVLADDAQEVGVGDAVRLVDLALVAARDELLLRRRRRRSRARRSGSRRAWRRASFSTWPVTIGSLRLYFSSATILMPGGLRRALHLGQPAVAVGVGEADEAHRLHAVGLHADGDRVGHQRVVLRRLEHPLRLRVGRIDDRRRRRHRDHRHFGFGDDVDHRQRVRRDRRADDDVDLVLA